MKVLHQNECEKQEKEFIWHSCWYLANRTLNIDVHSQRRSWHDSVQYTLSSYEIILSLIPGQNVWCWWWAVWNLTGHFQSARFSPLSVIPPTLYKQILLMYHRRCVFLASDRVVKYITLLCPYLILVAVILEELSKN